MRKTLALALILLTVPSLVLGWGEKGHLMVNRLAIEAAASKLPEFMGAGRNQLIYNAYEPDRWREEANTALATAQAPDHFLDSEYWGDISTLPPDRYAFLDKVAAKKVQMITIGYLPYAMEETYGRLRNAFRMWRNAKTPEDREAARVNALVYGGILGHYVGDGSNPLHMSYHYNGWDTKNAPNPNGYTTAAGLHGRFETAYVNRAISDAIVKPMVKAPERIPNLHAAVIAYLQQTFKDLEPLYAMEKTGEFNPDKTQAKGTQFIANHLARAATMLSNLWYTAWLESAEPARPPQRGQ